MIEFIKNNYNLILNIVLVITSVIIMCIKKKPVKVVDSAKEIVLKLLPGLINEAEIKTTYKGEEKKLYVLNLLDLCLHDLGYTDDCIKILEEFARDQIEVILSTPQKKGNSYEKS